MTLQIIFSNEATKQNMIDIKKILWNINNWIDIKEINGDIIINDFAECLDLTNLVDELRKYDSKICIKIMDKYTVI